MSSDLQSTLELLWMNNCLSRMVVHTSSQLLILLTNTVVVITVVIYDYGEQ